MSTASVQGTLALDFGYRVAARRTPELRVLPGDRVQLEAFAQRFATALVEVMAGDRGPQQLLRWTTAAVYEELLHRAALLQRALPGDRRVRRLRGQVRSVHVFYPSERAVELSVHVRHGERSRAIAARLELLEDRWCCTAVQFG